MSASAFDIAASGMTAHRAEMDVIAENIANAGSVRAPGTPYRERTAILEPGTSQPSFGQTLDDLAGTLALDSSIDAEDDPDEAGAVEGVRFAGYAESSAPFQYRYDPGSPFAAGSGPHRGFVALPNVDPMTQMIALVSAGRAYDGDVAALQAAKQMDVEAIDVDRP